MKTSTEIQSIVDVVGEEKAIEMIAKAGFDAWDFSMFNMKKRMNPFEGLFKKKYALVTNDYLKFARRLKQIGEENGVVCNQSHAPFPSLHKNVRPYLQRAIECTAEAGGKICVIHPDNLKSPKENAEFFLELLPFAKDYGVKIATENMWN
ncbi:MAG: sugar phosphate isomerase/epimerase family protein, partial [Eubacterium sp.]